ncbi:MAG: thymidine phosphorylase, partial [bacterium]|nr:thymidine phosphorylase [bacterium]
MLTTQIIAKKRDRQALSADEIRFMIAGMLDGSIPDYQMSAWCMAVLCRGMNARETAQLTQCMLESGESLKRVSDRPRVDKHSTGGL